MSKEPKWITDLDRARFLATEQAEIAAVWAKYLITKLPPRVRDVAAAAWVSGKLPLEVQQQMIAADAEQRWAFTDEDA